jgi:hypothetical protein
VIALSKCYITLDACINKWQKKLAYFAKNKNKKLQSFAKVDTCTKTLFSETLLDKE